MNINKISVKRKFRCFRIETGEIRNVIMEMLDKEPYKRITSSDVVNRLIDIPKNRVKKKT